jgi:uncharacterized protein (TIGR01777 family)
VNVFISGGTGFVGASLSEALVQNNFSVTILTRRASPAKKATGGISVVEGNPMEPGLWQDHAAESDVVINLAGASIFQRWNGHNKNMIRKSRVLSTRHIVNALSLRKDNTTDLINASAVGYYGYHGDELIEENTPPGVDFLASVCKEWETEALKAESLGSRVVLCRFGVVLGKGGGALGKLLPLFRLGLGSRLGKGNQWFSWIHIMDVVSIVLYLLQNRDIAGPVNCTSPNPVQNKEMTKRLARAVKRPAFMPPVPGFFLRVVLGEFAQTLIKGQRVIPKILGDREFSFAYPDFEHALLDIISG